jgi:hypothetical protein
VLGSIALGLGFLQILAILGRPAPVRDCPSYAAYACAGPHHSAHGDRCRLRCTVASMWRILPDPCSEACLSHVIPTLGAGPQVPQALVTLPLKYWAASHCRHCGALCATAQPGLCVLQASLRLCTWGAAAASCFGAYWTLTCRSLMWCAGQLLHRRAHVQPHRIQPPQELVHRVQRAAGRDSAVGACQGDLQRDCFEGQAGAYDCYFCLCCALVNYSFASNKGFACCA